jgi:hypothetical protein
MREGGKEKKVEREGERERKRNARAATGNREAE